MLYAAAALVFGAGFPLLVLTEYTDKLFAWTIHPPLTASFLGACYWSAGILEFCAARERSWCRARVAVPGVLLFTTLTCITTYLNFSHFNLRSPVAYIWIAVYTSVPPALAVLWWREARASGTDAPRDCRLPAWMRAGYAFLGLAMLITGAIMFFAPAAAGNLWPWDLNPPDSTYAHLSRMEPYVGVWLIGLGTVSAHASLEDDSLRLRCVFAAGLVLPPLTAVSIARYPQTVLWHRPATTAMLGGLILLFVLSLAGWRLVRAAIPALQAGQK